jgi:hypothetical protein
MTLPHDGLYFFSMYTLEATSELQQPFDTVQVHGVSIEGVLLNVVSACCSSRALQLTSCHDKKWTASRVEASRAEAGSESDRFRAWIA